MNMTENEIIKTLKGAYSLLLQCRVRFEDLNDYREASENVIKALEEVNEYRKIGTVEECREAVNKAEKKKPKLNYKSFFGKKVYTCPTCGNCCLEEFANERQNNNYCWDCGQRLDWSE